MLRFSLIFSLFFLATTLISAQEQEQEVWRDRTDIPEDYIHPPKTGTSLFYIQRNKNHNTIVYDVRLKSDGTINKSDPIDVYWRRYGSNGARKEISWFESMLAYGYRSKKNNDGSYRIKLRAYDERYITLKKEGKEWKSYMIINGVDSYITNIYAYADQSGVFPEVLYVDIHGIDPVTEKVIKERILNE